MVLAVIEEFNDEEGDEEGDGGEGHAKEMKSARDDALKILDTRQASLEKDENNVLYWCMWRNW